MLVQVWETHPEPAHATMASGNLFGLMGIDLSAPVPGGRGFDAKEVAGKQRVAILSENLWRRKFGADDGSLCRPNELPPLQGDRDC